MHKRALQKLQSHFPSDVLVFFSDCTLDFSLRKTQLSLSSAHQRYLKKHTGYAIERFFNIEQIHGKRVVYAAARKRTKSIPKADGALTHQKGVVLAVRTADCLPVFLYDKKRHVIGLLHVGWRGAKKNIVAHALKHMRAQYNTQMSDMRVAFGPAIRPCCYRVGDEFRHLFSSAIRKKKDGFYLDLPLAVKRQLVSCGVARRAIHDCRVCTCCDRDYFSFRRDGAKAGRMVSLMFLR